jgi:DNA-binding response OmpR family regulator
VSSTAPRTPPLRVFVVEDEQKIATLILNTLKASGFSPEVAYDGESALAKIRTAEFDLIILDIMLPGRDGLAVLREIRSLGISTPVLALSARGEVGERVEGLDAGADDYLAKPFVLAELLARVRALARRRSEQRAGPVQIADLALDPLTRTVRRGSRLIDLAAREYKLLEFLMRSRGEICSRSAIIKHVWEYNFDPGTNLVDVYVMRLREKIDGDSQRKLLHTIRGIGYVLKEEE